MWFKNYRTWRRNLDDPMMRVRFKDEPLGLVVFWCGFTVLAQRSGLTRRALLWHSLGVVFHCTAK